MSQAPGKWLHDSIRAWRDGRPSGRAIEPDRPPLLHSSVHASAYLYYATHVAPGAFNPSAFSRGRCWARGAGGNCGVSRGERRRLSLSITGDRKVRSRDARTYEPRVLVRRVELRKPTPLTLPTHGLASVVLVPSYAFAAAAIGTPGMRFHLEAVGVAVRLVTAAGGLVPQAGRLALYPMDSTRYFEFDWVWSRLQRLGRVRRYLDVSSPRFLPLSYVRRTAWSTPGS